MMRISQIVLLLVLCLTTIIASVSAIPAEGQLVEGRMLRSKVTPEVSGTNIKSNKNGKSNKKEHMGQRGQSPLFAKIERAIKNTKPYRKFRETRIGQAAHKWAEGVREQDRKRQDREQELRRKKGASMGPNPGMKPRVKI